MRLGVGGVTSQNVDMSKLYADFQTPWCRPGSFEFHDRDGRRGISCTAVECLSDVVRE
jgi:hypothetical protein